MSAIDLAGLAKLDDEATPGPWYVGRFDDEHFMSAISIEALMEQDNGHRSSEVIAATLIQQPRYVDPSDARWSENAQLIAEVRTALPELLRLAAIGLATEQG